jgi:hypothetical protein
MPPKVRVRVQPGTTYRCRSCTQLLPFDAGTRVPEACLRRCRAACDWEPVGPTDPAVRARAEQDGPLGPDGLPRVQGGG